MKVMTIVGTRPEIIKLSSVIKKLDKHVEHILVHTGQNYDYELNEVFFKDLGLREPDEYLNVAGQTSVETIGNVIIKSEEIIKKYNPDAILLYGDTNSCLSVISAKRNRIPIFHMEAGNRCFDQRVPEEINRKIVDHLSDINMTITEHARRYLLDEGIKPETVFKIGSSMTEVFRINRNQIEESNILSTLNLSEKQYFVLSVHREENVDNPANLNKLLNSINAIADKYKMPIIFSAHPRTRKKIEEIEFEFNKNVKYMKPLGFNDYNKLQKNSFCVISDSGTITEESSILGFSAITVRQAHERPEGMDSGTLIMSGVDQENILNSIEIITKSNSSKKVLDYDGGDVSSKVLNIIMSYTEYINRTVWKK